MGDAEATASWGRERGAGTAMEPEPTRVLMRDAADGLRRGMSWFPRNVPGDVPAPTLLLLLLLLEEEARVG